MAAMISGSAMSAAAAEPAGYYSSCEGKAGKALLQQLESVVGPHTTVSYKGLLDLYKSSDARPDGTVWDMYSTQRFSFGNTCGNYKKVGDCYNREHSFPKSWFNDASPMYSEAFHIYPTDGKVNGQRSNYPYGECASGTTLPGSGSVKALGKLGRCTFPGYSGTVFEPDDEYKGDFARSYFYMCAAYNSRFGTWKSDMLAGNSYPGFTSWAINLLLKWHRQDPVSQKELDRQEAVYARQRNRNPFIDHPDLAEHIWGDRQSQRLRHPRPRADTSRRRIHRQYRHHRCRGGTLRSGNSPWHRPRSRSHPRHIWPRLCSQPRHHLPLPGTGCRRLCRHSHIHRLTGRLIHRHPHPHQRHPLA